MAVPFFWPKVTGVKQIKKQKTKTILRVLINGYKSEKGNFKKKVILIRKCYKINCCKIGSDSLIEPGKKNNNSNNKKKPKNFFKKSGEKS